jgi:hypothetical protein
VEDRCKQVPYHEKKEHRGFLLAKKAEYFNDHQKFSWPGILPAVAEGVPTDEDGKVFRFFGTYSGVLKPEIGGIQNVGPMPRPKWLEEVAKSKFMVSHFGFPRTVCLMADKSACRRASILVSIS